MNLSITFIDFLVVAVILVSACYAAYRGFLSEVFGIFAWAAAAFATLYVGPYIVPMARGIVSSQLLAGIIGYAVVFLAVFIPLSFLSHRVSQNVRNSPIGPLDRVMGVAFGIVRGLAVVGIAYLIFTFFVPVRQQPSWLAEARLLPLIQSSSEVLLSVMPEQDRVAEVRGTRASDPLADVIERSGTPATSSRAATAAAKKEQPSYGASDRRALDKLIESTGSGSGTSGKP